MSKILRAGLLALGLLIAGDSALRAGPGGCTDAAILAPFGFETITVSSSSLGFTSTVAYPLGVSPADLAVVTVEADSIRVRADSIAPTASVGQIITAASGSPGTFTVCGAPSIKALRMIRVTTDATVSVAYYRTTN